jgi:hypothetical protein
VLRNLGGARMGLQRSLLSIGLAILISLTQVDSFALPVSSSTSGVYLGVSPDDKNGDIMMQVRDFEANAGKHAAIVNFFMMAPQSGRPM